MVRALDMRLAARWNEVVSSSRPTDYGRGAGPVTSKGHVETSSLKSGASCPSPFFMPHSIRLRGPWDCQPLIRYLPLDRGHVRQSSANLPAGGTIQLPADWGELLGHDFQGLVHFTRTFHRPTGLDASSRIWLVIEDVDWHAEISLNDQALGAVVSSLAAEPVAHCCPRPFEITSRLLPQNQLSIAVVSPQLDSNGLVLPRRGRDGRPGGLIGLVRLEIE